MKKKKTKIKDVHTRHCCFAHEFCKYGEEDTCTVVTGQAEQEFPCEQCVEDKQMEIRAKFAANNRCPHCGK